MLCIQDEINFCTCMCFKEEFTVESQDKFFGNFNVNKDIHSCISEVNFFRQKQQEPVPSAFNLLNLGGAVHLFVGPDYIQ